MDRSVILQYINKHFSMYFEIDYTFQDVQFPYSGKSFFTLKKAKPITITWKQWEDENLPVLFDATTEREWFEIIDNQIVFHYDIPSMIFYFLTGWQEVYCPIKDHYGRFPYRESIQKDHHFVTQPVVNYYFFILQKGLETILQKPISLKQSFCFNMTHDIDLVNSGWKSSIRKNLQQGHFIQAVTTFIKKMTKGLDPYQNLEEIIQIEKELGIQSTFYFLPKNDNQKGIQNADYDIKNPYIQQVIQQLQNDSNFNIGLHTPSLKSVNPEIINECIQKIDSDNIISNRFHYLALQQRDLVHFENTSIETDSSLGFAEHIGFRHSIAWPFHPFNFEKNRAMKIMEQPLVIMDVTLTNPKYMNLSEEESLKSIEELINKTRKVNGGLTLLWHNDNIAHSPHFFKLILKLFK